MLGRIAVPQMTRVARALLPLSITLLASLAGSPAWAAAGARSFHHRPALLTVDLSVDATRHLAVEPTDGAVRLDLPVTVR